MSDVKSTGIPVAAPQRRVRRVALLAAFAFGAAACAHIPAEAPQLSAELGKRITAIEHSHLAMLHHFMDERRARVDEFIQEEWAPKFAEKVFANPKVDAKWKEVVASGDPKARVEFLQHVGPKMQATINAKRVELTKPLDDIERAIERRLRDEYEQALAVNNTLTSFLQSASDLEANRDRYVAMAKDALGIKVDVEAQLNTTADLVQGLVDKRDAAQRDIGELENAGKDFRAKATELATTISGGSK